MTVRPVFFLFTGVAALEASTRLGIFGGTFDPIHYGHLLLAEICRQELTLDAVRFVPAGNPPHKSGAITDGHARADMVALAVSGYQEFTVDRREIQRDGPSFTVLTLHEIQQENPDSELFFLMGADSLCDFPSWRDPAGILELSTVVAVNRPGTPLPRMERHGRAAECVDMTRIRQIAVPGMDISASDLRNRMRDGRGVRFLTPRAVEAFLTEHNLYVESS